MTQEIEHKCYTLPSATWLDKEEFQKGREQDRQALDFILPANTPLQIRQPDISKGKALLRLICNDSQPEKCIRLNTEWQTVTSTVDCVPFIDTLYTAQAESFSVIYQQPTATKPLPCWTPGQSEESFFQVWGSNKAPYALLDLVYIRLLLPYVDREKAMKAGLSALHTYYSNVFTHYNNWAGLSDNPDSPLNQNVANRYFVRADIHGVGSAYYLPWWCAQTAASIGSGWLDNVDSQWLILHEIAHGYQGKFMNDTALPVDEVWNNIYAAYYQQMTLAQGNHLYTGGWLYNYGKQAAQEQQLINHIANKDPIPSWGLRPRLHFLMLMLLKAGTQAFRTFNQQYRALANSDNFTASEHPLADVLATAIAAASGYDVIAFMNLCGLKLQTSTCERIASQATKPLWPLYDLLAQTEWESARQLLGLDSAVWLVDNRELAALNKTATLSLTLAIDDLQQIYGRTLTLSDSCGVDHSVIINDSTITLNEIPIGVYQLTLPKGRSQKYLVDITHITLREGSNAVSVNFSRHNDTSSRNVTLNFLGLSDARFASLEVDYVNQQLVLDILKATPHSYFANELYASICVLSASGEKVFEQKMNGTDCTVGKTIIPFSPEYHLYVYHAEPGRLKASPGYLTLVAREKYQLLRIDENGVYNFIINNNPSDDLLTMFRHVAQQIRDNASLRAQSDSVAKNELWLMLAHIEEPAYSTLVKEYADVLPQDNSQPDELTGQCISLELKGQGNKTFCEIAFDNQHHQMCLTTRSGAAHAYYSSNLYASILITEPSGAIVYSRNFSGGANISANTETLALTENMIIELFHDEPFRCSVHNDTTQHSLSLKKSNRWRVVTEGLEVLSPVPVEEDDKGNEDVPLNVSELFGDDFIWQLLGDKDIGFAHMAMDIGNGTLSFTAKSGVPHAEFSTTYASVSVYDTRGSVVYRQSIKGASELGEYTDTARMAEGYTIEMFHAEAGERSLMVDSQTNKRWQQPNTVVWQVTARGLKRLDQE